MGMRALQQKITTLLSDIELRLDEPLSKHTSFRIGGPAAIMAFPKSAEELEQEPMCWRRMLVLTTL